MKNPTAKIPNMKTKTPWATLVTLCACLLAVPAAQASTNVFFDVSQTATVISSNLTAVTLRSGDYLFTYSQDGYFTGGVGLTNPVGRFFTVFWPTGVQAQAITVQPTPPVASGANITLKRVDGKLFDLESFTGKILLNTAGAGAAFEIMPKLAGEDALANPVQYPCSGYYGQSFPYTASLVGYDAYAIHMWGDFALTALTLIDTNPVTPPAPNFTITTAVTPVGAGAAAGAASYPSNTTCSLTATPSPGWGFKRWTENGAQVSTSANYNFTVRTNRSLVANFVPAFNVATSVLPAYGGTATGGGMFNSNTTVTVRATPASGFQFVNWTDYGTPVSTATNYSFTLTGAHDLVANFAPLPQTAIFDFDTASPALYLHQPLGASVAQSNRGLTATFSVVAGSWSFQDRGASTIGAPPAFSGLFLYPGTWWSTLQIQFSEPLTDFSLDFMTGELSSEWNTAGTIRVTAHTNSLASPAVGTGTATGQWINGAYPEGHLAFHSATPFDVVLLDFAPIGIPSGLLYADNIVVQRAVSSGFAINASVAPANSGNITGTGYYTNGQTANLSATANPGFLFVNWTEGGNVVSASAGYSFSVSSNRTLVANFAVSNQSFTISAVASPLNAGTITGAGAYTNGETATLVATPDLGFIFTDWTEGGTSVSASPSYSFNVSGDRELVANFITNSPPLAFGSGFFQLTGQPLAINISDLMWSDYDPDGDPVWFDGVSATSSNGLPLNVDSNAWQILVPANVVADGFSYNISDGNGGSATGTATISIIQSVTSHALALDPSTPGGVWASFAGVPWYTYEAQRATNAAFTGPLQTWLVQAWDTGLIDVWDDFTDLGAKPPGAFYRLRNLP